MTLSAQMLGQSPSPVISYTTLIPTITSTHWTVGWLTHRTPSPYYNAMKYANTSINQVINNKQQCIMCRLQSCWGLIDLVGANICGHPVAVCSRLLHYCIITVDLITLVMIDHWAIILTLLTLSLVRYHLVPLNPSPSKQLCSTVLFN